MNQAPTEEMRNIFRETRFKNLFFFKYDFAVNDGVDDFCF